METRDKEIEDELSSRLYHTVKEWNTEFFHELNRPQGGSVVIAFAKCFALLVLDLKGTPADLAALKDGAHPSEFPSVDRDYARLSEFVDWLLDAVWDKREEMKKREG